MTNESTTPELIAEDPPPPGVRGVGGTPVGLWLNALRAQPGIWHKYPDERRSNSATVIKRGDAYGVNAGEFEAVNRTATSGMFWLYARYVGGES